ncbi:AAA family ATPase [Aeromonas allosaccharophila]|uniref:AAA family ATPase n=1 Tax=Aeromonas allosaccharophila TaxID=656 RepID=UPI003D2388CA
MIKSITLQNITSYHPITPTTITLSKQRTIFFGQNGSGKSTIGRLISAHAKGERLSQEANVKSDENTRYYVYNSDFIRESFYEPSAQPGVFTVGKDDSNIQFEIDQLEKHRELKSSQISKLEIDINENEKHKENILKRYQESIFQHKKHYQKDALSYCLKGKSLKASFFDSAMSGKKISDATLDDLVREKNKLDAFSVEEPIKPEPISTHTPESDITKLLESPLISTSTSYFSSLIEKLHNQHWVRDGREYLKHSDVCPFCQKTPTNEFQDQLDQVFNSHYDDAISNLNTYKGKYDNYVQSVKEQLNSDKLAYIENNAEFQKIKNKFIDCIETNEKLIVEKIKHPEKTINLIEQTSLSTKINTLIEAARLDIDGYSSQLAQKKTIETNIEKQFWGLINEDLTKIFSDYQEEIRLADIEKEKNNNVHLKAKAELTSIDFRIKELASNIVGIDSSLDAINNRLRSLGLDSFELIKHGDGSYRIHRSGATGEIYHTLSEGEKTLISLVYFIEMIKGDTEKENCATPKSEKVIVIDDPISSLSSNYVYDVATMIHNEIFEEKYGQSIILTHNLFFYHELLKQTESKYIEKLYSLYRVKKDIYSEIVTLGRDEIKNDYELYWAAIKTFNESNIWSPLIPNAMRNILEHYFSFVHKNDKLHKVISELEKTDHKFKVLYRYMNRSSHSDAINISDISVGDYQRFMDIFKKIFEETGDAEHYRKMISA